MFVTNEFEACGHLTGEDEKIALKVENDFRYTDCVVLRVIRYKNDGSFPDVLSEVSVKGEELKRAVNNCLWESVEEKTDG